MPDGVVLRADRYYPRHNSHLPTMLVRTPYGRKGYGLVGRLMAERGFQVLIQSCRGSDDSGGEINPFRGEGEDGLATLEWLKTQDWFDGRLGMAGPSYLGFTQWALARDAGPELKAISTQVTSAELQSVMYPGGSFNVVIDLWPTAYHFKRGHRLRVQVSSGAFPRFARNLGTGEPLATATSMQAAEQQVFHDPAHPSVILLPVSR